MVFFWKDNIHGLHICVVRLGSGDSGHIVSLNLLFFVHLKNKDLISVLLS